MLCPLLAQSLCVCTLIAWELGGRVEGDVVETSTLALPKCDAR